MTTAGATLAANLLQGGGTAISHMALGSDNTTPTLSDTALIGTEHERVAGSFGLAANEITMTASFGTGITGTVTVGEFGIFNAASGGTLFARFVTPAVEISSTDTLAVIWKLYLGGQ